MNVKFLWVGKTRSVQIKSLVSDYLGRLEHLGGCEIVEIRDISKSRSIKGRELIAAEGAEIAKFLPESGRLVVLDERGKEFTSEQFARWLESEQTRGTREVVFIIGGVDGISPTISERAHLRLSLGKMTWTHEMIRVLLLEQVYRAFSILRNFPYHR